MVRLTEIPLELFERISVHLQPPDLFSLYQTSRALRHHLHDQVWTRLYIGPTTPPKRLHDGYRGVSIGSKNQEQVVQMIEMGQLDYVLATVTECRVRDYDRWANLPFDLSNLKNLAKLDITLSQTSAPNNESAFASLDRVDPMVAVTVSYTGSYSMPADYVARRLTHVTISHLQFDSAKQLASYPNVSHFRLILDAPVHASTLLQFLSSFPNLQVLKLDTVQLANPIPINFIPRHVHTFHWTDRSRSPSMATLGTGNCTVVAPGVKHLSITTLGAFDLAQYRFPSVETLELHCIIDDPALQLPMLMRKRLHNLVADAAGQQRIQNVVFDMPPRFLPDIVSSMDNLTLNAKYGLSDRKQLQRALGKCSKISKIAIEYAL